MKWILCLGIMTTAGFSAMAQQKEPIYTDNASIFNYSYDPYYNYAQQGQALYQNNAQFYQKDNFQSSFPSTGNGQYIQPGNSNPINQQLYDGPPVPAITIYSGHVPVREAGGTPEYGREGKAIR